MPAGRPRKNLDKKQFKSLCAMFCTLEEIAAFFECSEDTVERWCKREYEANFAEVYKEFSAAGKISLRRNQMKMAEKNVAMAIFLGKNYLGQKDAQDTKLAERTIDAMRDVLSTIEVVSGVPQQAESNVEAVEGEQLQEQSDGPDKADD